MPHTRFTCLHLTYILTYLCIYLLTPWSRILLKKLTGSQLVKKLPTFNGSWRFITVFTKAHHLPLYWDRSFQSIPSPHPTSWRCIWILYPDLCLGLICGLFPSGFPTKPCLHLSSPPISARCPAYPILNLITQIIFGEEYRSLSSSLCSFLHSLSHHPS
jgi:hypothetical protein